MIVDPIIREIACSTAFAVVHARMLKGELQAPALEPLNAALVEPTYHGARRVPQETDEAEPRFEGVTRHV